MTIYTVLLIIACDAITLQKPPQVKMGKVGKVSSSQALKAPPKMADDDTELWSNAGSMEEVMKYSYDMHMSYFEALNSTKPLAADSSFLKMPKLLQAKNQKGNAFRTETCSSMVTPTGRNADVFKKVPIQLVGNKNKAKVACMIYSYDQARQAQRDSFATWGQDCDSFLVFSNEQWVDKEAGFKTIEVHPPNGNEKNLIGKLHASFKEVQRRLDAKELDFDFLTVSGDDSFWLIPNLRYDLENNQEVINAADDKGFIYGHIFSQTGDGLNNFASGAGYVIDKKALKLYVQDTSVKEDGWYEDVRIARSLSKKGIPFIHAQEVTGEHMAHVFQPLAHAMPWVYTSDGWIRTYERAYLDRMQGKKGINAISKRSILFHYLKEERTPLHNQFYGMKTCQGIDLTKYFDTHEVTFVAYENKVQHYIRDSDALGGPHVTHTLSKDSTVPLGVYVANGVAALVVVSGLAVLRVADEKSPVMGLSAIVCYIALSCVIDININVAGNGGHGVKFEPAVSVLIVELGKLAVSMALYTMNRWSALCLGETFIPDSFRIKDVAFLAMPGGLFALNNILIYLAIGYNDMASFGVFRDTVIFFNAMIWCVVFKSELGSTRLTLLLVLFGGLCINQITPLMNAALSWSVLIVIAMTLTNAFASVANEYAIKQNSGLDLNLQNAVLYTFCSLFAVIYVVIVHPTRLGSLSALFAGFDGFACLIAGVMLLQGLLVSRILKYADSVTKAVGSCLRGPLVVFLAPLIGLHSRLDLLTALSSLIVATAATLFLMQGRPAPGIDLNDKAEIPSAGSRNSHLVKEEK